MFAGKKLYIFMTLICLLAALLILVGNGASVVRWKRHRHIRDQMSAVANASGDSAEIIEMGEVVTAQETML